MSDEFVFPVSSAERRFWFLQEWDPQNVAYNVPAAFRLRGPVDHAALESAFQSLVRRHEVLRTTFALQDGQPVQIIHAEPSAAPIFTVHDLAGHPADAVEASSRRLMAEEIHKPFDLSAGPLLRAAVIQLGPGDAVLVMTIHHIVCDGWALGVLIHELTVSYNAVRAGAPSVLPPLDIQYPDYTLWQNRLEHEREAEQLTYWRECLKAPLPVLEIATDYPRPAAPTGRGTRHQFRLPAALIDPLQALSAASGATLFMTLLAAFQTLLHRYTDQTAIIVAVPVAGRNDTALAPLIGCFLNTLAMRADLSGDPRFRDLVARVRSATLEAFAHQDLPFDALVEALQPERSASYAPICQVAFVLQNTPQPRLEFDQISAEPIPLWTATAKFDLTMAIEPGADWWTATLEYREDLFEAATIARMADHFIRLLGSIAADPDTRLSELTILSPAERRQLLTTWNQTRAPYPDGRRVHELFEEQVARVPDAVAVVCDGATWTYARLNESADELAVRLRQQGAGPGHVIGLCYERSVEAVLGMLAVLKIGAAYVPLDPTWGNERMRFVLEDAGVRLVLTPEGVDEPDRLAGGPVVAAMWPAGASPGEDVAYLMYTSGSTGEPKAVSVVHRGIIRLVVGNTYADLTASDVVLHTSSLTFDASTFEVWSALLTGARLVIMPMRHPTLDELGRLITGHSVSVAFLSPDLFHQMVDAQLEQVRSIRQLLVGGDVLSPVDATRFLASRSGALINAYGPTENTVFTCCHYMTDGGDVGERVPIGRPIANTDVYVLDAHRQPVPIGVPGELYTGGAGIARGYWKRPALTAERFVPHPFSDAPGALLYRTGDRVRYLADGRLEFLGRIDRQVKIRGFRVELEEIEAVLLRDTCVREAAVIVHDGGPGRRQLVAYVVPGGLGRSEDEIRRHAAQVLPDYMVPSLFVLLDELPKSASGKVDRRLLPSADLASRRAPGAAVAPRTPVEEILAAMFCDLLQIDHVGIEDDFFALGGHSLLAMQLVSRIRTALGRELPVRAIFEARTVSGLAGRLEDAATAADRAHALQPANRSKPLPLSFAQRRLWFLDQIEEHSSTYHVDLAWQLDGPVDVDALRASITALVERHEALRTIFPSADGVPVQIVTPAAAVPLATAESNQPFDLARGPLFRAAFVRQEDDRHALVLTMHHIVCDGWSINILCRELSEIYAARVEGRLTRLAPVGLQYVDYAAWQQRWLASEASARQLAYWTARLTGAPPSLDLPIDRPRPPVRTTAGARISARITPELTQGLTALSRRHGVTLYMTLLAAFGVLLSRHTSQTDIVIGSPTAGRPHADLEPVVGLFVNTLIHRITLTGDPSVVELLRHVRDGALDAYANGDLPFDALVEALHTARDPGRTPIFQTMFALQHEPDPVLTLPGVRATPVDPRAGTAKFDLLLVMRADAEGLRADFEYNTDLFDLETIQRLCDRFVVLLENFPGDDHRQVSALSLLPESERRLLAEWNETDEVYPRDSTIHELFAAEAGRRANDVVVIQGERRQTYGEINERADALARRLRDLGVGGDVPVGVCTGRSPETIVALLAILKAGGAYLPLNPSDPIERLTFILRDAAARVVFAAPGLGEAIARQLPGITTIPPSEGRPRDDDGRVRDDLATAESSLAHTAGADSLACIMYTSGSTGEPKGVAVPHRAVVRLVYGLDRVTGPPARRFLQLSPLSFDASTFDIWVPLLRGGQCVLFDDEPPTIDGIERAIDRYDIECLWLTSALFNAIVDERPAALAGAREIFVGGEALSPPHIERALNALPAISLVNGYGPTEATTFACCHPIDRTTHPARSVPIGRPLANTRVFILDSAGQASPIGVIGELYIGGDGLARGYVNRPDLTARKFVRAGVPEQVLYRTGDLGRFRPNGSIEFVGRTDRQIKLRGFRIELEEIEAQLERHPDVRQVAVTVRAEPAGDKSIVAFVALRHTSPDTVDELREFLSMKVPAYMVPSTFVVLNALPLTDSGKIDRAALPDAPPPAPATSGRAPHTDTQRRLAVIWAEVLGADPVSLDENFFEAGGHSLLAMRVIARIESEFGVTLPVSGLFHAPTIADLARTIEASHPIGRRVLVPLQPGGDRPPLVLVHALGGEVWPYVPLALRLAPDQPCFGLQLPDFEEGETFPTIEALASRYVDALIQNVPGPYTLAGYSSGAVIAFEMAHQLEERGQPVLLVVAVDAGLPNRGSGPGRLTKAAGMVRNIPWWIRYDLMETPPAQMADRLRRKLSHTASALAHRMRRAPSFDDTHGFDLRDERGLKVPWGPHRSTHYAAVMAYRPRRYAGRVMVLKARARPLLGSPEHDLGWSRMVSGDVSVCWIPGSHETILREPYAREVARHIRLGIDTARNR